MKRSAGISFEQALQIFMDEVLQATEHFCQASSERDSVFRH